MKCDLEMSDGPLELDEEEILTVFRINQEFLTNVTRHAMQL